MTSAIYNQYFTSRAGIAQSAQQLTRLGRSGARIPVRARFSGPIQTGIEADPATCATGTVSFSRG